MPHDSHGYAPRRFVRLLAGFALTTSLLAAVVAVPGEARAGDVALTAADTTAPNIVGDSNVQSQPQQGPNAFTIAVEFCNEGAVTALDGVVAYIGDDLPDIPLITRVGLGVAVANARSEVKARADYVTSTPGGSGAIREVVELIMESQGAWDQVLDQYGAR